MYDIRPNLVLGFHGCEVSVRDVLLNNPNEIKISQEPFDWLGHGMYFWENNYERALRWAWEKRNRGSIKQPAVIGAVIYPGHCCDFLDQECIQLLSQSFKTMKEQYINSGMVLPVNKDLPTDPHKDKVLRNLDCAVIEYMHDAITDQIKSDIQTKGFSEHKLYDTTRGVFTEGGPAFPGAGLFAKSHIQICVRNPNCIKGFFMPRREIDFTSWLEENKRA
jgi:hypothetical protein